MGITSDIKKVAQEIVFSYQSKISTVGMIIDDTYKLLEDFKTKRNKMSDRLKETLAREESLRKTDFDNIMEDIFAHQGEREKEIKDLLKTFFEEQKEIAELIKKSLTGDTKIGIDDFKKMLQDIQARQRTRENEVSTALRQFQAEYKEMTESLSSLLNKGETIQIKDLKEMARKYPHKRERVNGLKGGEFKKKEKMAKV